MWFYIPVFSGLEYHYVIQFNSPNVYGGPKLKADSADGCVVERKCPNCKNDKMSYATLQLRSADEGQTVFYTCVRCK
jgi:DNA-directed RNA polymerase I subunit RPA12